MDFIDTQKVAMPDLVAQYTEMGERFQKRHWHQLTDVMVDFLNNPAASRGDNFIQLYEHFIKPIETRLNQGRLVGMVAQVATQYYPTRPFAVGELDRAISLVSSLLEKRGRLGEEAYTVCLLETTSLNLKRATVLPAKHAGEAALDTAKKDIDTAQELFDSFVDASPAVPSTLYRVAAEYYKIRGPAAQYYHYALQFLAHNDMEAMPEVERQILATDVAIAALVGKKVFNFGEIVAHPVMSSLAGTPHAWLSDLLKVFHSGDIDGFNGIVAANRAAYEAQPALVASDESVKEKVSMVCVMELASKRLATDRSIPFAEIAEATRLPIDSVEWLLMQAMSLELIKGVIDEVDQVVHVSFIKPRVMDTAQIEALRIKMAAWSEKVKSTLLYIEDRTRELFA